MSYQNSIRLLIALFISSSLFLSSWYWYQKGAQKPVANAEPPIGYITNLANDVQKRKTTKVLWESSASGEDLFAGEALRTAKDSEAKFKLFDSNTELTLLPESLIILERNESGLELNFLSGDVFINSAANAKEVLTIKSGDNSFNPTGSSVTLRKDSEGELGVEVHRGKIELKSKDTKITVDTKKNVAIKKTGDVKEAAYLQIYSPVAGEEVLISKNKLGFDAKIEKLENTVKVFVETGSSNKSLKRDANTIYSSERNEVFVPSKVGRIYWRVVAQDSKGQVRASAIMSHTAKLTQSAKADPIKIEQPKVIKPIEVGVVEWLNDTQVEVIETTTLPQEVELSWKPYVINPNEIPEKQVKTKYKFKVHNNSGAPLILDSLESNAQFNAKTLTRYNVIIEAYDDKNQLVAKSQPKQFNVILKSRLPAPAFSKNLPNPVISTADGNVQISWEPVEGAIAYEWEITSAASTKPIKSKVTRNIASIENLHPGEFNLTVHAIDKAKRAGQKSTVQKIKVPEESSIQAPKIDKVEIK